MLPGLGGAIERGSRSMIAPEGDALARSEPATDRVDQQLLESLGWSPIAIDAIDDGGETDAADRSRRLLELELCGRLIRLTDGRLQRVR
jgi:DNA processing protein